jgi:hypothetical protein
MTAAPVRGRMRFLSIRQVTVTAACPPQAVLPVSMETRSRGVHTEAGKGPRPTFFLEIHKSSRHCWKALCGYPTM